MKVIFTFHLYKFFAINNNSRYYMHDIKTITNMKRTYLAVEKDFLAKFLMKIIVVVTNLTENTGSKTVLL